MFFGYTNCPDVCPMTLHKLARLLKQLGAEVDRLTMVFISVDADRDRPQALRAYTERFDPRIVGLTGDAEQLQAAANASGVLTRRYQGKTALAYALEHSSLMYLLDPAGRVRLIFPAGADAGGIAADLKRLWQEEWPTEVAARRAPRRPVNGGRGRAPRSASTTLR